MAKAAKPATRAKATTRAKAGTRATATRRAKTTAKAKAPAKRKAPARRKPAAKGKHKFVALYDREVKWQQGDGVNELLTLPPGVKVKILNYDRAMKRIDMKVKFPPGYVEPEHSHKSWHSICVLKGRMCVAGKDLRAGDYVFGGDIAHGPYEYPDGCEVFTVFMGEGTQHIWDESKHLAHKNKWRPKTSAGKKGVERQKAARAKGKVSVSA